MSTTTLCQAVRRIEYSALYQRFVYRQHRCGLAARPPHAAHWCRYCGAQWGGCHDDA